MPGTAFAWSATLVNAADETTNNTYTEANVAGRLYDRDGPGTGFGPLVADLATSFRYVAKAASTTSHSAVVGSKTFSNLIGGFGFYESAPVRVVKSSTDYMDGVITAVDLPGQTVTINVTSVSSAFGSHASWTIGFGPLGTVMASSPATIAQGGTGGGTAAAARTNLAVKRHFDVSSVLSTPPGSPTNGQAHIAGASPSGGWVEHTIETYVTGTGWVSTVPDTGDTAYDAAAFASYVYTGTGQAQTGIYSGSRWKPLTSVMPKWVVATQITGDYTVVPADHGSWMTVSNSSLLNITLPSPVASSGIARAIEIVLEIFASNGGNTVIAITGGSNIRLENGTEAANITVTAGTYRCLHLVAGNTVSQNFWYVWKG
jgi:hypothetical protein